MVAMARRSSHDYNSRSISPHLSMMRKKLKPLGIEIVTKWTEGYFLTDQSYDIIAQVLAQQYKQTAERECVDERYTRAVG